MKEKRTTVAIEENLLKAAKNKAVEADISLKELLNQALKEKLDVTKQIKKKRKFRLRTFDMGQIKTPLTREDIYEEHLNDIIRQ